MKHIIGEDLLLQRVSFTWFHLLVSRRCFILKRVIPTAATTTKKNCEEQLLLLQSENCSGAKHAHMERSRADAPPFRNHLHSLLWLRSNDLFEWIFESFSFEFEYSNSNVEKSRFSNVIEFEYLKNRTMVFECIRVRISRKTAFFKYIRIRTFKICEH